MRRLLLALAEPPGRFGFRLCWSRWRRRHQATAQRCHAVRRARRLLPLPPPVPAAPAPAPPPLSPELTEDAWQRARPLLPPQRPPRGRPYVDHRRMVAGILWVERTGCSWATLPARFGPWQSVYHRYRRWLAPGLWAQILTVLDEPVTDPVAA